MLTQLSVQIFREESLFSQRDLIKDPASSDEDFYTECIQELVAPINKEIDLNAYSRKPLDNLIAQLQSKVVYVAFNKTFECTWLSKLSQMVFSERDCPKSIFCILIRELTVDLSDWFRLSAYSSLNLIGPLLGSHTLKKLAGVVQVEGRKQYDQLEWVQEGRTASLLYLYFYAEIFNIDNIQRLCNEQLSPSHWIKGESERNLKEWTKISALLKEYCYYDVQNMVDGVNWLKKQYAANKASLVSQTEILSTVAWLKSLSATQLEKLLGSYIGLQDAPRESRS
ncbi:DUF2779 domain-containing protein [Candidatus Mycoplasma haematominutum]|nr:DUF2779 domain-containing protein [Candidatus Mycoplasma haematominutum]